MPLIKQETNSRMQENGKKRRFKEILIDGENSFCVPRQDLPGMMKSLISSHKPRF